MIEELYIASKYRQRVVLTLHDGNKLIGVAQFTNSSDRIKIQTLEGSIWVPLEEIEHVDRLINLH